MAQGVDVAINIGSAFKGKKAFKQADNAVTKLMSSTKKLAGAIGIAYGTRAVLAYGKASMIAAADDQKAQKILANNLKNVGLAYASVDAESCIQSMEKQTAILDDQLRPAYSQLAQTTGSISKTQELMKLAFDASSGSGLDYATTVDIISKAYVGNTKGLKALNLGLTQAELKSMSFAEIQDKIAATYAGSGVTALDTYAGSMAKLSVATSNASETIGGALLDAVVKVSGSKGIDGLISKIDTLASGIASVITQIGNMVGALNGTEAQKAFSGGYMISGGRAGSFRVGATGAGNMAMSVQSQDTQKSVLAAQKKADALAKKRAADILAAAKKADIATKNNIALTTAARQLDIKNISIAAALKETYDKDTQLRLLAMKAIEEDNGQAALDYLKQLGILQASVQADKLKGIEGISNASLHAINMELLAELQAIDASKMSEAAKDEAKMAAYAKYNDAITKQGELMALGYYDERTQVELTYIAKRAALDNYDSAQATLRKIALSADMAAIDEVSLAQALADESRNNNMIAYIALIDEAKYAAFDLAAATAAAASEQAYAITALAQANADAQALADAANAASIIAAAEAAAAAAAIIAAIPPVVPGADIPGTGGATIPGIDVPDYGGTLGGINLNPNRANDAYSAPVININSGPLIGTEETIADAVQLAIQTLNRRGSNTTYAGAI